MSDLYPAIEPHLTGRLDVGDAQQVYWEVSGNPDGKPVVFLHGGPGAGTSPDHRRLFDPERYRIVLLDQRGCGRSTPYAGDPATDLSTNTTWTLVADLELLREHLGVDRWQVFGGSWGSTLALAYAETHPDRVLELVVRGVWLVQPEELDWFYEGGGASAVFPDLWASYVGALPAADRVPGRMLDGYARLLADPDPEVHGPAAQAWARWTAATITLLPRPELLEHYDTDPASAVASARIENHFIVNRCWLAPDQLIRGVGALAGIPVSIVQGRYDMCTPVWAAWRLHDALPEAELDLVDGAGHAFDEPGIRAGLVAATDRYADR